MRTVVSLKKNNLAGKLLNEVISCVGFWAVTRDSRDATNENKSATATWHLRIMIKAEREKERLQNHSHRFEGICVYTNSFCIEQALEQFSAGYIPIIKVGGCWKMGQIYIVQQSSIGWRVHHGCGCTAVKASVYPIFPSQNIVHCTRGWFVKLNESFGKRGAWALVILRM